MCYIFFSNLRLPRRSSNQATVLDETIYGVPKQPLSALITAAEHSTRSESSLANIGTQYDLVQENVHPVHYGDPFTEPDS
jgi:hypothetical protein